MSEPNHWAIPGEVFAESAAKDYLSAKPFPEFSFEGTPSELQAMEGHCRLAWVLHRIAYEQHFFVHSPVLAREEAETLNESYTRTFFKRVGDSATGRQMLSQAKAVVDLVMSLEPTINRGHDSFTLLIAFVVTVVCGLELPREELRTWLENRYTTDIQKDLCERGLPGHAIPINPAVEVPYVMMMSNYLTSKFRAFREDKARMLTPQPRAGCASVVVVGITVGAILASIV